MNWIEGMVSTPDGYRASVVAPDGKKSLMALAAFESLRRPAPRSKSDVVTFDASKLERGYAREFRASEGCDTTENDGHEVFALRANGHLYLIPAFVLLSAIPGSLKSLEPSIFEPNGLEKLCSLCGQDGGNGASQTLITIRNYCRARRVAVGKVMLARLTWMKAYPSGYKFWCSLLDFARSGRLDFEPPVAKLTVSLKVRKVGELRLVDHLVVRELIPLEAAFLPAMFETTPTFVFSHLHMKPAPVGYERPRLQERKLSAFAGCVLSDEEWWLCGYLLLKNQSTSNKGSLRAHTNIILNKLATGVSWRHGQTNNASNETHNKYLLLRADGRWKLFIQRLLRYRAACTDGPPSIEWLAGIARPMNLKEWSTAMGVKYERALTEAHSGRLVIKRVGCSLLVPVDGRFFRTHVDKLQSVSC